MLEDNGRHVRYSWGMLGDNGRGVGIMGGVLGIMGGVLGM